MARVWLDIGTLLAGAPAGQISSVQLECVRQGLASEPGYFAFCDFDAAVGFRNVEASTVSRALEELSAAGGAGPAAQPPEAALEPSGSSPGSGLRGRVKRLFGKLTSPWSKAATAESDPSAAPFGDADVFVPFSSEPSALRLLASLREKMNLRVVPSHIQQATAAHVLHSALVMASQGGSGFEERLQHLYASLLQEGDACIDIGAHTGRHSLPMSCAVGVGGSVTAFEPNPSVAQRLRQRLGRLAVTNVTVHETALSDEAGTAEFVIAVDRPEESGLRERTVYNGATRTEKVAVQLAPLDSLELVNPRFIKLDTEGAEYKVMLGARQTVSRWRPVVAFEFGQASYEAYGVDPGDMYDYFGSLDYQMFSILGEPLARAEFVQASKVQLYWDYVACSGDMAARVAAVLRSFGQSSR